MDLVTGATGIVGAHVVCESLRAGRKVKAIVRGKVKREHLHKVIRHYGLSDKTDLLHEIELDILDVSALLEATKGVEFVYHCAAMVSFAPHEKGLMWKVNVEGTANIVNACLANGVQRLCHVSSVASIGRLPNGDLSTESDEFKEAPHVSPYSYTKHYAEMEIQRGIAEGLDAFMVNPSVIFGPGIPGESSMALFDRVSKGSLFHPSGTAAIVDARDVAKALVKGSTMARSGERHLLVGDHLKYSELFAKIAASANVKASTRTVPRWALDIGSKIEALRNFFFRTNPLVTKYTVHSACSDYRYDSSKAQKELGMEFIGIDDCIANARAFRVSG